MQTMICKDGAVVTQNGNVITSSKGEAMSIRRIC